jgi:precorrin-6B methylase 2
MNLKKWEFNSEHLREGSAADFLTKLKEFDAIYDK